MLLSHILCRTLLKLDHGEGLNDQLQFRCSDQKRFICALIGIARRIVAKVRLATKVKV